MAVEDAVVGVVVAADVEGDSKVLKTRPLVMELRTTVFDTLEVGDMV